MVASGKPRDLKVAILAGGTSGERDISLASGKGASAALVEAGFTVEMLDPAVTADLVRLLEGGFDVAFICLHGKGGEDGSIQGLLEIARIPYIGSGVWSSALAIDKAKAKIFYERAGISTPCSVTLTNKDEFRVDELIALVGPRCVVKPATEGSALGVFVVQGEGELADAIERALEIGREVLVETYVSGIELTIAVLGNADPVALPIIEIVPAHEFYDFESKYAPGGSQHICPARISKKDTLRIKDIAVKAHRALGCRGVSRTDVILDEQGIPWVLETNTIPGMTETSLLPDAGRAAGLDFPELCSRLIGFALEEQ